MRPVSPLVPAASWQPDQRSECEHVARYDSPNAGDRTPAGPQVQSTGAGAGTSAGGGWALDPQAAEALAPEGAVLGRVDLSTLAGLSGAAGQPEIWAQVHQVDTQVPAQTLGYAKSLFTGQDMSTPTSGQNKDGPYSAAHIMGMGPSS